MSQNIQIETQAEIPWMTLLLVFGFVAVFAGMCQHSIEFWTPHSAAINWMKNNCYHAGNVQQWIHDTNIQRILTQLPVASMAAFAGWQLVGNSYFLWVFGSRVEQKLGALRYLFLAVLGMIVPYLALHHQAWENQDQHYYYGACFLISTIIGASWLFPDQKEINTKWFKEHRGEIFDRTETKEASAKWAKKNMTLFLLLFVVYEIGIWFFGQKFTPEFATVHWAPVVAAVVMGWGIAWFLVWSATGDLREGPVKLMTIRHYNSVLKMDLGHEEAIRDTSMKLGLPEDRVRVWVASQKGKMQIR